MKHISIIGTGLIGGSLGTALRKKAKGKYFITGIGRNPEKLKTAKNIGAVDAFTTDFKDGVKDADIIVICTPVHLIAPMVKKIIPFIKSSARITNAGSVKGAVLKDVKKVFLYAKRYPQYANFVGAHPMAGSEKSGIKEAKADLYNGAAVVIIKTAGKNKDAFNEVSKMWKAAGANIVEMSPEEHDKAVALISHLPHIIAFNLSLLAGKLKQNIPDLPKLIAGSFKDATRVAGSSPADWASICGANREQVSKSIDSFIAELKDAKKILNKPGLLEKKFEQSKTARQKLLHK